ncbi:hypothetical protein EDM80_03300 [bacterium]|nr:MAG: hypothetical protein EDM80_03300 [bacterium]RIK63395.1 MAG: hypothetical protein DCC64_07505 [Planctomycetota bacterium]
MHCVFLRDALEFLDYPFSAASVFPGGRVDARLVQDVDSRASPPEVRLKQGEVLFVAAPQRAKLAAFATALDLPDVSRPDAWAVILRPWSDPELDESDDAAALGGLAERGITRAEVEDLREILQPALAAYCTRSGLWDRADLGLFDALAALSGSLAGPDFCLPQSEFAEFYRQAMEVAARG